MTRAEVAQLESALGEDFVIRDLGFVGFCGQRNRVVSRAKRVPDPLVALTRFLRMDVRSGAVRPCAPPPSPEIAEFNLAAKVYISSN